jgi:hypothetical protein
VDANRGVESQKSPAARDAGTTRAGKKNQAQKTVLNSITLSFGNLPVERIESAPAKFLSQNGKRGLSCGRDWEQAKG